MSIQKLVLRKISSTGLIVPLALALISIGGVHHAHPYAHAREARDLYYYSPPPPLTTTTSDGGSNLQDGAEEEPTHTDSSSLGLNAPSVDPLILHTPDYKVIGDEEEMTLIPAIYREPPTTTTCIYEDMSTIVTTPSLIKRTTVLPTPTTTCLYEDHSEDEVRIRTTIVPSTSSAKTKTPTPTATPTPTTHSPLPPPTTGTSSATAAWEAAIGRTLLSPQKKQGEVLLFEIVESESHRILLISSPEKESSHGGVSVVRWGRNQTTLIGVEWDRNEVLVRSFNATPSPACLQNFAPQTFILLTANRGSTIKVSRLPEERELLVHIVRGAVAEGKNRGAELFIKQSPLLTLLFEPASTEAYPPGGDKTVKGYPSIKEDDTILSFSSHPHDGVFLQECSA